MVQGQLEQTNRRHLESLENLIQRLDGHLVSLRETVADVTRFVPFVNGQRGPDPAQGPDERPQQDGQRR